jgi:hypothetical protein
VRLQAASRFSWRRGSAWHQPIEIQQLRYLQPIGCIQFPQRKIRANARQPRQFPQVLFNKTAVAVQVLGDDLKQEGCFTDG